MKSTKRLWRWLGLVFVLSFGALGYLGWQIYLTAPPIPKAVTKTVQTLSDAASKSFTVTGYILSVILIDSVTKEQVIGDVSFENATASANGKVTVTLAAAPSYPILVIITSIAL